MPVQKFRSFRDAEDALWRPGDDPDHLRSVAWVWSFSDRLSAPRAQKGVRRYRSLLEAQRDWDQSQEPR